MTNKELINKFPFLEIRNRWTGEVTNDEEFTELDAMPVGWRKAFGEKMCEEIQNELNSMDPVLANNYRILDIKEKYGSLRWNTNWTTMEINKIVQKYEELSEKTCIDCGAPATKISKGWIEPYCDECAKKVIKCDNLINIEDYFNEEDKDDEETSI